MSLEVLKIVAKDGSLQSLKFLYADVVQIKGVNRTGCATAVMRDNSRRKIQLAPGQHWIAGHTFRKSG